MGRIVKRATAKHENTLSSYVKNFVEQACSLPLSELVKHLQTFPRRWPFPRGDLYHWIPLLNRFDDILERFNQTYGLDQGPQTQEFGRILLLKGDGNGEVTSDSALDTLAFGKDGDRELVEYILAFTKLLFENCGNRSVYASSDQFGDLLRTTSLSLLKATLSLALCLAQRYHQARQRHTTLSHLSGYYGIPLDRIQLIAVPFTVTTQAEGLHAEHLHTGKEKLPARGDSRSSVVETDIVKVLQEDPQEYEHTWSNLCVDLDTASIPPLPNSAPRPPAEEASAPPTPTPARRVSSGPAASSRKESWTPADVHPQHAQQSQAGIVASRSRVYIPHDTVMNKPITEILGLPVLQDQPAHIMLALLHQLRVTKALSTSKQTHEDLVAVRLLAIANVAYVYSESMFTQHIGQQDSNQPRRLQLIHQLAQLIAPPTDTSGPVSRRIQTIVFQVLDALARHPQKAGDVLGALNVNVNHGILLYVVRKAAAELREEDGDPLEAEIEDEWREALFSLLNFLPNTNRTTRIGEQMVGAGLVDVLVDVLTMRTAKAELFQSRVLAFLDTFVYNLRDAFQALIDARGMDIIAEFTAHQVTTASENAQTGKGMPTEYKTQATDYEIPFYQYQTLKNLFKLGIHMLQQSGGAFDRLLRNLIESPQLLGGLKSVLTHGPVFGSSVWSGALEILTNFINNEPTSYQAVAEAGLAKSFLEAITGKTISDQPTALASGSAEEHSAEAAPARTDDTATVDITALDATAVAELETSPNPWSSEVVTVVGKRAVSEDECKRVLREKSEDPALYILPTVEAMCKIPHAFGAICLNENGMKLFQGSPGLDSFFEIFESPKHVRALLAGSDHDRMANPEGLGQTVDELVRHHPPLKEQVLEGVKRMVMRVVQSAYWRSLDYGEGTKMYYVSADGKDAMVTGGWAALRGPEGPINQEQRLAYEALHSSGVRKQQPDNDVPMSDVSTDGPTASFAPERSVSQRDLDTKLKQSDDSDVTACEYMRCVTRFLNGFFENSRAIDNFCEIGAVEYMLDFATIPSLPFDFDTTSSYQALWAVVQQLIREKPHLILPSLVKRTIRAMHELDDLIERDTQGTSYFAPLSSPDLEPAIAQAPWATEVRNKGTLTAKVLVKLNCLSKLLAEALTLHIFTHRSSNPFAQVNLADLYVELVDGLGAISRKCIWEEVQMQKLLTTGEKPLPGFGVMTLDDGENLFKLLANQANTTAGESGATTETPGMAPPENNSAFAPAPTTENSASNTSDANNVYLWNRRVLRRLLVHVPSEIRNFLQSLGRCLLYKRTMDSYQRQNSITVADHIAQVSYDNLKYEPALNSSSEVDYYTYVTLVISQFTTMIVDDENGRQIMQCLTLVLHNYKQKGGIKEMGKIFHALFEQAQRLRDTDSSSAPVKTVGLRYLIYAGIRVILDFWALITEAKIIVESPQSVTMSSRSERDKDKSDYFSPSAFLVELRYAILEDLRPLWESESLEKAETAMIEKVIQSLRAIFKCEGEDGAPARRDRITPKIQVPRKTWRPRNKETLKTLTDEGYDRELALEALYRCYDNYRFASEYCARYMTDFRVSRTPVPAADCQIEESPVRAEGGESSSSAQQTTSQSDSGAASGLQRLMREMAGQTPSAPTPPNATDSNAESPAQGSRDPDMGAQLNQLLNATVEESGSTLMELVANFGGDPERPHSLQAANNELRESRSPSNTRADGPEAGDLPDVVSVDLLDEKRNDVRDNLITRCLDILNVHHDVTFDLADLINAAITSCESPESYRSEIATILIQSLLSLAEDDLHQSGKKIAAYAHLIALLVQDREFYTAAREELADNFEMLIPFIKIPPSKSEEPETASWVGPVLLILEKCLAHDEQPPTVSWQTPPPDGPFDIPEAEVVHTHPPLEQAAKESLFESIIEILPRVGKDSSLALSIGRILVILSRHRDVARMIGTKQCMQKLFVMMKQLAGRVNEKLSGAIMIILRHVVEDDTMIRHIMRTDIRNMFETRQQGRTETFNYTRQMYHLALRDPEAFVETTGEMLTLSRYDQTNKSQVLSLKRAEPAEPSASEKDKESKTNQQEESTGEAQKSKESALPGQTEESRPKTSEPKAPVVEHPDGVIHYLLCELLSYKDVDDKEPVPAAPKLASSSSSTDVVMTNGNEAGAQASGPQTQAASETTPAATKKPEKPVFKAEDHPIFMYRCLIMQCLVELLGSYYRTKVEFINFSRKADPQATTPSKPRSSVLNYLLNNVIPLGSLEHSDDIASKKKHATSDLAIQVLVALCAKTDESPRPEPFVHLPEDEPELSYARRIVVDHALKAYRDATASQEGLDVKYARVMALGDLFHRMLLGKPRGNAPDQFEASTRQLGKIMVEKGLVRTLADSASEIDLNFPGAKRVMKYVMRPLKFLTTTAVDLSVNGELSTNSSSGGHITTDEDEDMLSDSSATDPDDLREETPDLFRNSALGILEPHRDEEDSDDDGEEDDEDDEDPMFVQEYDEEMDFDGAEDPDEDDEMASDDEDSDDEDDEIPGVGTIEGLPGDVNMNIEIVADDDDDDEDSSDEDSSEDDEDDEDDDDIPTILEGHGDVQIIETDDSDPDAEDEDEDDDDELDDGHEVWPDGIEQLPFELPGNFGDVAVPETAVEIESYVRGELQDDDEAMDEGTPPVTGFVAGDLDEGDDGEDEDEDGEEEEEDYDDDIVYEPEYEEDDEGMHGIFGRPIGWGDATPPNLVQHHHHRRHRLPWDFFPTGEPGGRVVNIPTSYRAHRPTARANDDGTNPLLQRTNAPPVPTQERRPSAAEAMRELLEIRHRGQGGNFQAAQLSIINNLMEVMGGAVHGYRSGQPFQITFSGLGGPGGAISFTGDQPGAFEAMFGGRPTQRHTHHEARPTMQDPASAVYFQPWPIVSRWQEEARMLFGNEYIEKAQLVIHSIMRLLVPPAMEAKQKRDKEMAERKAKEDLRKALEAQKKAEEDEKKRKEEEERQKAEQEAEEARRTEQEAARATESESDVQMEGVEQDPPESSSEAAAAVPDDSTTGATDGSTTEGGASSEQPARTMYTFRGREVDITNLGIDVDYLDALPEDLRTEVLMGQIAEQRSAQVAAGATSTEQPSGIDSEFLDALPPDIREEILRQEAMDRRRRERDEARRRAASTGAPAQAEEMDPASFLATLPPHLRQAVLMEQDEETLGRLPDDIAEEARALAQRQAPRQFTEGPPATLPTTHRGESSNQREETAEKRTKRPVIQLVDKSGVAGLLRMVFTPLQGSLQSYLNSVLKDLSENRQHRADIVSTILNVLQEGSTDLSAVERSFLTLTARAKSGALQKTPQPLKRTSTAERMAMIGADSFTLSNETTPLMVVQQSLSALAYLAKYNHSIAPFFLSEHDTKTAVVAKSSKKGKSKDLRSNRFPINQLLTLLDRPLVMESSKVMEELATLLTHITRPLLFLVKEPETAKEHAKESTSAEGTAQAEATDLAPAAAPTDTEMASANEPSTHEEEKDIKESKESGESDDKSKKAKGLPPPDIPEHNLRLVVNILTARECSSKTFRDTLSLVNHLSIIPEAKDVFGQELVKQAQDLAQSILTDLLELASQIAKATSPTDVQGMALAKFAPASSDQAKLLRVLTALDYLFNPKANQQMQGPNASNNDASNSQQTQEVLSALYESSNFHSLWARLSECLTAIRQQGNMLSIATILLPLVESLMIVCKNTTLKESPLAKRSDEPMSASMTIGSPSADAGVENLFFRFTEEHRKILNDLVRHNPKLMSGTFSLLVKNSKVLEFDNKRNYFNRKMHQRGQETRVSHQTLQLAVRRDHVFLDSFKSLYFKSADEIKFGKLSIRFHGEEGVDAGGVTREWFQALAKQMFNEDYALWKSVSSDRTTFQPNTSSSVNEQHLMFFKFIGRIIGKALYEGRVLDCHFSRAVYKQILGKSVNLRDMETIDLDLYKSMSWMLENDITDSIYETFSVENDEFGVKDIIDLTPNGHNIPVTEENKQEYVRLFSEWRMVGSVREQLDHFLTGFHDIVPKELIAIFTEQELELLISGLPDIDIDDWKNNTEYHNYNASSPQIQWFWRAVRSFDKEERAKLLQFVTGTSKVPLNGFKELEGMSGFSRFNIHRDYGNKDRLPSSHTCFNQLDLPEYESYEALRQQLYTAFTAGSEYFGFA